VAVTVEFANELGLLRTIIRNLVRKPSVYDAITQEFLRAEGLARVSPQPQGLVAIRMPGHDAFNELSDRMIGKFPAMERGVDYANFQAELLGYLANTYIARDPASLGPADVSALCDYLDSWFTKLAAVRTIFVPCAITPWAAPRFAIGPVIFIFIEDAPRSDFYPNGRKSDALSRDGFDRMLQLMRDTRANWLACVRIEGCELDCAQEMAALAVDLAIVALQLAIPLEFGTRMMSRLDTRRGFAEKRTLSETDGDYNASWSRIEPGISIGAGTLADFLRKTEPLVTAVGSCVQSYTTGSFRFPKLERAWCDAAYWLREALAEPLDTIAVAKLETALEVLFQSESASRSERRILTVLAKFFGLGPDDVIVPGGTRTAKQLARDLVRDRSRILHGTWSTLTSRLTSNRAGLEGFVITILRTAALDLESYAHKPAAEDNLDAFLDWVDTQRVAQKTAKVARQS
jgi:hypothetical protein